MIRKALLTVMLMSLCTIALASDTDWLWQFDGARFGTGPAAVDGFDALDSPMAPACAWHCGTFHEQDADWSGETGFYSTDVRAPLQLKPGESKTWTFYVWEDPTQNIVLELNWGWSMPNAPAFGDMTYTLTYVQAAQGVTDPAVGKSVTLNEHMQGTWRLPVYKTDDGRNGYKFSLTATVVPEPSTFLALFTGICGIGGLMWRRRRR